MTDERPIVDVSELATAAFGSRDPVWWAVLCIMAIEGTVFALLWMTLLYIRPHFDPYPPSHIPYSTQWLAAANMVLLFLTCWPIALSNRAAEEGSLQGMRRTLLAATALIAVCLALRAFVFRGLGMDWMQHSYGSTLWMILGLHTTHLLAGFSENIVLLLMLYLGPVEEKHLVDVHVSGLYWYFVVILWIPSYALIFLDPSVIGHRPPWY